MSDELRRRGNRKLCPVPSSNGNRDRVGFRRGRDSASAAGAGAVLADLRQHVVRGIDPVSRASTRIDPRTGRRVLQVQVDPATGRGTIQIDRRQSLLNGLTYAVAVMAVLGAHEMGHFLQAPAMAWPKPCRCLFRCRSVRWGRWGP